MINYNCTGERRKKLVQALTKITGEPSVYLGICMGRFEKETTPAGVVLNKGADSTQRSIPA